MRFRVPPHDSPMHGLTGIARALSAVPGSIRFAALGLGASVVLPQLSVAVTPDVVLVVLLPGLVFEAAYRLHWEDLRRSYGSIAFLAVPGVILSAAIVAAVLTAATGLRPELAFVVGAMVSATDPAAVVATFARLGAPRRLVAIVDAESLLNDGTGLVVFAIAVRAVGSGIAPVDAITTFLTTTIASALGGMIVGAAAAQVIVRLRDHRAQVAVSLAAAYGVSLAAAALGLSGIIATVVAGAVLGNYGRRIGLAPTTEAAFDVIWERIASVLTALIFVAVGLAIGPAGILGAFVPIAWGVLGVIAARAVVVYLLMGGALVVLGDRRAGPNLHPGWLHLIFWAGLRGAVATAAALSLPLDFPERELLVRVTFGIVLVTLTVQGSTAGWLLRRSGVAAAT